jgi:hypothetical protein
MRANFYVDAVNLYSHQESEKTVEIGREQGADPQNRAVQTNVQNRRGGGVERLVAGRLRSVSGLQVAARQ